MNRLVTVVPVYNGERFLRATLESLVNQTRRPDRVIIQDNCSTDGTRHIAKDFEKKGFEWILNGEHVSSTDNFNSALRYAEEADFLHLLTADDIIKPKFYECLLEVLEPVTGRALAYSAYEVIDHVGEPLKGGDLVNPFPVVPGGTPRLISRQTFVASQSDLRTVCLPAVIMKTGSERLPVEFRTDFIQCADAVFYAELASHCEQIVEVPAALCQYRRHECTTTSRNRLQPAAVIEDEWKAMRTASALLDKTGLSAWLWDFRQRCLLAGTSRVMLGGDGDVTMEFRSDVVQTTRAITGNLAWYLGNLAVALRDFLRHGRS
ncbi:MAG: glycosyltransferase [Verrucomicrobiota bacterium]|nr:glycosyltransferase [Verrucomicrobiota bacterium]MEE2813170.1 glycosyltransferase [Verrucomicrobiota bacterium]